jgi:hypothetical protein
VQLKSWIVNGLPPIISISNRLDWWTTHPSMKWST